MKSLHLIFKLDGANYAVPASEVLHLESFEGATRVPGALPYVAGLVQIRRRMVPVLDLRARFGLPPAEVSLGSRVVVVHSTGRTVGLWVDSAREVISLAEDQFRPPPEMVARQADGFVKAVAQAQERLLMLIDLDKVIGAAAGAQEETRAQ